MVTPKKGVSRILNPLLRFGISFGAIALIFFLYKEQLPAVFQLLKGARIVFFGLGLVLFFAGLAATAVRLQLVLQVQAVRVLFPQAYYVNLIALFFNNILPTSAGGEVVRGYYLYQHTNGKTAVFSGVIVDRLFGLATMVVIGFTAIFLVDRQLASARIINSLLVMAVITLAALLILLNRRLFHVLSSLKLPLLPLMVNEKLQEIYQAMHAYRSHGEIVPRGFGLTVVGQVSFILTNFMLAKSLGLEIPIGFFFFFVPIMLVMGLAPSVNGIGVREAAYLFFLVDFTSADQALALSLTTTFFMLLVGGLSGVVYAFKGGLPAQDVS